MQNANSEFEQHLKRLREVTAIDESSLRGNFTPEEFADGWASSARKEIHESYWGDTILKNVKQKLSEAELDFDTLWETINIDEFFYGSGAGRRMLARGSSANPLKRLAPKNGGYSVDDLKHVPSIKVLHSSRVHLLSPFMSNRFMRDEMLALLGPLVDQDTTLIDLGSG